MMLEPGNERYCPITIDRAPLVEFEIIDGDLKVSMLLLDNRNRPLLVTARNQISVTTVARDVEREGRRLIIRAAAGEVLMDLAFRPPNMILIRRGHMYRNGVEILIRGDTLLVVNSSSALSTLGLVGGGIIVGPADGQLVICLEGVPRFGTDRRGIDRDGVARAMLSARKSSPDHRANRDVAANPGSTLVFRQPPDRMQ